MQKSELFDEISRLLNEQVQCVLATVDESQPCLHLMAYSVNRRLDEIYIASYANTRKVSNMLAHPEVALLWDNRTVNDRDHVEGVALNATGKATLLEGVVRQAIKQKLLDRNPALGLLLADESTTIFTVKVSSYVFVKGYTQVYNYLP